MSDAYDRYEAQRKRTSRKADLINRSANSGLNPDAVDRAENNEEDK